MFAGKHVVFGEVVENSDLALRISELPVLPGRNLPLKPVRIVDSGVL